MNNKLNSEMSAETTADKSGVDDNTKSTLNSTNTILPAVLKFGDYCTIEQHRYGCDNEHYIHKVIGTSRSNKWVDVPVMHNATETLHNHMEDVVSCICCGVCETEVFKYRLSDVRRHGA